MNKQQILDEIKRSAEANGGAPLGQTRFAQDTGIKVTDWHGKYWARWGDALQDAGFRPNQMQAAYADNHLIERFIDILREVGRFPVRGELKLKARADRTFPSHNAFARLGPKRQLANRILEYCKAQDGIDDVIALCAPVAEVQPEIAPAEQIALGLQADASANTKDGYVYMALLKLGREKRYKIGKAVLVERRTDQISLQLPEDLELVHAIRTDDAYGIEEYWHKRFAAKRTRGEWFSLSRQEIEAFRRRKFM
ncbi:MAG TPA: GIY-YIG nuclease family protein [Acetobacteraceae bacterium]|nr:GIY-YIG nuclease family protein [Acetobacteraceae bacterium]